MKSEQFIFIQEAIRNHSLIAGIALWYFFNQKSVLEG
jgi:hypothetical protein